MNEMHADYFHHSKGFHMIGMRFLNVFGEGENEKEQYASIATQFLKNKEKGELRQRPIARFSLETTSALSGRSSTR